MSLLDALRHAPLLSESPLAMAADVIVFAAVAVVATAIILDFRAYLRQPRAVVHSDRSLVETGTMTAFFLVYYLCIRFARLEAIGGGVPRTVLLVGGLALLVVGTALNVYGRVKLQANWANQIKIYEGHTLVTCGPYRLVRHPLYASLIWMFVAGSLVYANPLALVLTLGVFVPMMYVRGRKEERLLEAAFPGAYAEYRSRTGMFIPRLRGQ